MPVDLLERRDVPVPIILRCGTSWSSAIDANVWGVVCGPGAGSPAALNAWPTRHARPSLVSCLPASSVKTHSCPLKLTRARAVDVPQAPVDVVRDAGADVVPAGRLLILPPRTAMLRCA